MIDVGTTEAGSGPLAVYGRVRSDDRVRLLPDLLSLVVAGVRWAIDNYPDVGRPGCFEVLVIEWSHATWSVDAVTWLIVEKSLGVTVL